MIEKGKGEGQSSCYGCESKGKWNRHWITFLYKWNNHHWCSECLMNELEKENNQLKIKYATEVLKQKGITTCINWGGFQLNELDEAIQNLIDLAEEEGKSE